MQPRAPAKPVAREAAGIAAAAANATDADRQPELLAKLHVLVGNAMSSKATTTAPPIVINATTLADACKREGVPLDLLIVKHASHTFSGQDIGPPLDEI